MRVIRVMVSVGLGVAVVTGVGCSRWSGGAVGQTTEDAGTSATAEAAQGFPLDADPPVLEHAEYSLPGGAEVSDYHGLLGAYSQNTFLEYPANRLGLMDLDSGEYSLVVSTPVSGGTFNAYSPAVGEGWMAWEEADMSEGFAGEDLEWRLYAAPVDAGTLTIGQAVEIDHGFGSYAPRPIYDFAGSELVWVRDRIPSDAQEGVVRSAEIVGRDMNTGVVRTLYERTDRTIFTMRATPSAVVFTEFLPPDGDARRADIVTISLTDGAELSRVSVDPQMGLSHYADSVDGWTLWASFEATDAVWPALNARDASGDVVAVSQQALDPVCAGGYVFFECIISTAAGSRSGDSYELWALDLAGRTMFPVIENTEWFWQTCPVGADEDVLVTCGYDFTPDASEPVPVRVYRFDE